MRRAIWRFLPLGRRAQHSGSRGWPRRPTPTRGQGGRLVSGRRQADFARIPVTLSASRQTAAGRDSPAQTVAPVSGRCARRVRRHRQDGRKDADAPFRRLAFSVAGGVLITTSAARGGKSRIALGAAVKPRGPRRDRHAPGGVPGFSDRCARLARRHAVGAGGVIGRSAGGRRRGWSDRSVVRARSAAPARTSTACARRPGAATHCRTQPDTAAKPARPKRRCRASFFVVPDGARAALRAAQ